MIMLNIHERRKIERAVARLWVGVEKNNQCSLDDLENIKKDLRLALGLSAPLLIQYIETLEEEQFRFDPWDAYLCGKLAKWWDIPLEKACYTYIRYCQLSQKTADFDDKLSMLYSKIKNALDSRPMMERLDAITAHYRVFYGVINQKIEFFLQMGYEETQK